ncbi:MAG: hypothetical protein JWP09_392 [Candidatus Taylorbacteria bacterium]|nr:hypothetical protein [Candidatus Taylorbacteria bacterium]
MKLLIITQSIDKKNTVLGFFHSWVEEFAKRFEKITVICLEKGEYDLPQNVKVLSLGKEMGESKMRYVLNFYNYIWNERKNYDTVFVHMNQEYVLLGSLLWKLLGKKVTMWRNHHSGNFLTDVACLLCDKIFCTSKFSYTAKFKQTVLMPVGIDTDYFKFDDNAKRTPRSILFLGRIAPIKKPDVLIEALRLLKTKGVPFKASLYGDALSKDMDYYNSLKKRVGDYGLNEFVSFHKGIPNTETALVYSKHDVFVNLSSSGMFDKTIFEAMACGCVVLCTNKNLRDILPKSQIVDLNPERIAESILTVYNFSPDNRSETGRIQEGLVRKNSLRELAQKLQSEITSK